MYLSPGLTTVSYRINLSEFGTIDHDLHRVRRAPVARFFSRANVSKLESEIKEHVQMLCDKLLRQDGKEPYDVKAAYSCFTADVISGEWSASVARTKQGERICRL